MIRGLEDVLASRKAFFDATSSRDFVASGDRTVATPKQAQAALQQLVRKAEHGFVGLFNQGATCYLNSFIQSLYMLPSFRQAVFEYRLTPTEVAKSSVAHNLQGLFLRLSGGYNGATSTHALTKSFGWSLEDVFQQQDVQEMFQKLFEAMQMSVIGCSPSDPNYSLSLALQSFSGRSLNYVTCQKCLTRTPRPDTFLNLTVPIKGVTTLHDALLKMIEPEVLEGDNAYRCSVCQSKERALKGMEFIEFPEIFSIQLARFEMDWNTMQRIKTTTNLAFEKRMNVQEFLGSAKSKVVTKKDGENGTNGSSNGEHMDEKVSSSPASPQPVSTDYELTSILVHAGAAAAGHYYAYILDSASGNFLKFNDSTVEWLGAEELQGIFGDATSFQESHNRQAKEQEEKKVVMDTEKANVKVKSTTGVINGSSAASALASSIPNTPHNGNGFDVDSNEDEDDDTVCTATPKKATHTSGPFVDPKKHAYILIYRRVDHQQQAKQANGHADSSSSSSTSSSTQPQKSVTDLISEVAPEILVENAEFARREAQEKEEENKILIKVHYDPIASAGIVRSESTEKISAAAGGASSVAASSVPTAPPSDNEDMHHIQPSFTTSQLTVQKNSTLTSVLENIYASLKLQTHGIAFTDCRIRLWDGLRHIGERPFTDVDMSKTCRGMKWNKSRTLLLETRTPGGQFPKYQPKTIGLNWSQLKEDGKEVSVKHVEVDPEITLAEYRKLVASWIMPTLPPAQAGQSLETVASRIKLFLSSHGVAIELIEQTKTLTQLRIIKSDTIFSELIPLSATNEVISYTNPNVKSKLIEYFERKQFATTIKFNNPFLSPSYYVKGTPAANAVAGGSTAASDSAPSSSPSLSRPSWETHELQIDARSSLGTLKQDISVALNNLPLSSFRLRSSHSGPELKALQKNISFYGLNGLIYVELGTPLNEDEFILRVLKYVPEKVVKEAEKVEDASSSNGGPPTAPLLNGAPPSAPSMAPPCAPPLAPPCAPPMAPSAPPMAPPGPPGAPPMAPPSAPGAPAAPSSSSSSSSNPLSSPLASAPLHLSPSDPFELLGEIVLNETDLLDQVKTKLRAAFPSVMSSIPYFRIREKLANKLTRVFRTDLALKQNCTSGTLKDFKILVVQQTPIDEKITSSQILFYTSRWWPKEGKLDSGEKQQEWIVDKEMKFEDLQKMLSETTRDGKEEKKGESVSAGEEVPASALSPITSAAASSSSSSSSGFVPPDQIGLEKPLPYQLSDMTSLASLKYNTDWINSTSTFTNSPIRVRDGDLLIWCDRSVNQIEQYNRFNESDEIVHSGAAGERSKQKELKIFSPQEQLDMEMARQLALQFEAEEREILKAKEQAAKAIAAGAAQQPAAPQ